MGDRGEEGRSELRVLIVDDSPGDAYIVEMLLDRIQRSRGPDLRFEVDRLETLSESRVRLASSAYDLVILDLSLPDGLGTDFLRSWPDPASHPPVIILTGLEDEQVALRSLQAGAQDFLVKNDLDAASLERSIRHALERHQLLKEREHHQRIIAESLEIRFRDLVEGHADGILLVSREGSLRFANLVARRLLGFPPGGPPTGSLPFEAQPGQTREILLGSGPGGNRWVEVRAAPTTWDGVPARLVFLREVTESHLQREKLERATRLASIGRLASGVAHELNNPLHVIGSYADIILQDTQPTPKVREYVTMVREAASRCTEIAAQLLAFSRTPTGALEPVFVRGAVQRVGRFLERQLSLQNIRLETSFDDSAPVILGNELEFQQVMFNLMVNARDAMPRGGTLSISTRLIGRRLRIDVADDGIGMGPEVLDRIFDSDFTTKDPGKGTGLGLSLVKRTVEKFGGEIAATSRPEAGTRFEIRWPIDVQFLDGDDRGPLARRALRVLLAESDDRFRGVCEELLTAEGHQVVPVAGHERILELLIAEPFDLLMVGAGVLRSASGRMIGELTAVDGSIPVIVMAAAGEPGVEHLDRHPGQVEVLVRPLQRRDLERILDSIDVDRLLILVVDDDDIVREVMVSQVNGLGLPVMVNATAGGQETIAYLDRFSPDVVLLDLMMPGMDGFRVCREIRSRESPPSPLVIAVTGIADREVVRRALDDGADYVLHKPLQGWHLENLRTLIAARRPPDVPGPVTDVVVS